MSVTPADQVPFKGEHRSRHFVTHSLIFFSGDLKIMVVPEPGSADNEGLAALRLREGEEESCLWHLRCEDGDLRASIRTLLTDA